MSGTVPSTLQTYIDDAASKVQSAVGSITGNSADKIDEGQAPAPSNTTASVNPGPGEDERLSKTKIEPLASSTKDDTPHDTNLQGSVGSDTKIDQARIEPLGGAGVGQNPAPKADSQGVVGRDNVIQESKIQPLAGALAAEKGSGGSDGTYKGDVGDTTGARTESTSIGVDDEVTDGARIAPLGGVKEDVKP